MLFEIKQPYGWPYTREQTLSYAKKKTLLILNIKDFKVRNLNAGINFENKEHLQRIQTPRVK